MMKKFEITYPWIVWPNLHKPRQKKTLLQSLTPCKSKWKNNF